MDPTHAPLFSVVICTYNRAGELAEALESLCRQSLFRDEFEVIVVDNNSTDSTPETVRRFASQGSVRYCVEPAQGLSHARNRGLEEAHGTYVGYLDDDARAPRHWLAIAREIVEQHGPTAFGGPYVPYYSHPKPRWFKDAYGSRGHGESPRELGRLECLSGGNMFARRDALHECQGYDPAFGMRGSEVAYGEEDDLQRRLRSCHDFHGIRYDPRLCIEHLVRPQKMTVGWRFTQSPVSGRDSYRTRLRYGPQPRWTWQVFVEGFKAARRSFRFLLEQVIPRQRRRYPYVQNYLYEVPPRFLYVVGIWMEHVRGANHRHP